MTTAPAATAVVTTAAVPTYQHRFTDAFSSSTWYTAWGTTRPWHTSVVTSGTDSFLRVAFLGGTHDGSSWFFKTGDADHAHLRYRLRLSPNWDSSQANSNIKLPGFGSPVTDTLNVCLVACGGAPGDGVTGWSARGQLNEAGIPGNYVYDGDMLSKNLTYGSGYTWYAAGPLAVDRWYTIDLYVDMNTPGQHDGHLTAYVDGAKVWEKADFSFRLVDTLHVGSAWFDFYYGGSGVAPQTMWMDIDDVVVEW